MRIDHKLDKEVKDVYHNLDLCIERVNERIDKCSTKEIVAKLREDSKHFVRDNTIMDMIKLCNKTEQLLTTFTADNNDVKTSVLQFDKLLC